MVFDSTSWLFCKYSVGVLYIRNNLHSLDISALMEFCIFFIMYFSIVYCFLIIVNWLVEISVCFIFFQVTSNSLSWFQSKNWSSKPFNAKNLEEYFCLLRIPSFGFSCFSSVQHECIPQAILGMDVICQAKSGMGKTAVFVLSTLQQIEPVSGQVAALVLCHTRELAYQVCDVFLVRIELYLFLLGVSIYEWQSLESYPCKAMFSCDGGIFLLLDRYVMSLSGSVPTCLILKLPCSMVGLTLRSTRIYWRMNAPILS